ncbi:ParB/RepB/Spo0J family partition protein [Aliikangiella maris]|uniref:ParB N-terminal domain-containing protein n=2 Tax=Aliikangiella maris TaxID=3162458 RepID=A0ABV3MTR6_9GAMM
MSIGAIQDLLKKSNLNQNLSAKEDESKNLDDIIHHIELELIEFDKEQPRQELVEDEIYDIVRTLRAPGSKINQPITVWPKNKEGKYLLKYGEKRTRASLIAERKTIPAVIDSRYDYDNEEHRAINFAEQYIENNARGGLQPLDDCVALAKLKTMFGNLKDVMMYVGAKSQGTISDKIKVSEIKTNPRYDFLKDFYYDEELKLKDLTIFRNLIKVIEKNEEHYEQIKTKVITAVEKKALNRTWVEGLLAYDFDKNEAPYELGSDSKKEKKIKEKNSKPADDLPKSYKVRPVKKAKVLGRVSIDGRKKVNCQLLLDRIDNEEGYVWVLEEGADEPTRVNLSKLSLTEIL